MKSEEPIETKYHLSDNSWLITRDISRMISEDFLEQLELIRPSQQDEINVRGMYILCPRYTSHYGGTYRYSGVDHDPIGDIPEFVLKFVSETFEDEFGIPDAIIIQLYTSGLQYIGAHSDDTRGLDSTKPIIGLVLGNSDRPFRIRKKKAKQWDYQVERNNNFEDKTCNSFLDIQAPHGTMIVMGGDMQKEFKHEVPRTKRKVSERMSITFRYFE